MDAIVLLGAPGSGKGTLAEDIRDAVDYAHVSTGDILRKAIKEENPLGQEAKRYMDRGELVPDELIVRLIKALIDSGSPDAKYMLDGFPRTFAQAVSLDEALDAHGAKVSRVFLLEVPREVLVRRICGRRICRSCSAVYNVHTKRPKVDGVCDFCGGTDIYQRADDTEETLNNRLDVYERQTAELIDYYAKRDALVRVDAEDRVLTRDAIVGHLKG
ncbi:MAG: adenylate kinase [Kiritimatiellia bacterium]|jgi:adenylate kinase